MLTTVTSAALLQSLRDPANATVWNDYVGRYRPLLLGYARRLGLADADAEDVAQHVLLEFATGFRAGRFDPARGRLRDWLFGIARTSVKGWRRRLAARPVQFTGTEGATDAVERIEDTDHDLEKLWEQEWRDAVLRQCLVEVRREVSEQTLMAFDLFARRGLPATEVAQQLGMTENAVFGAKRRVLRRIREIQPLLEEAW